MTYNTNAEIAKSETLFPRLVACAAEQDKAKPYETWVEEHIWDIAVTPGWSEAWAYAKSQGPGPDLGSSEVVITDGMILAAIQPMV